MRERTRGVGIIVVAVAVGAAAGPPVVAVADDVKGVIIENTSDAPVMSKAVGTTPVTGTVGLADGTTVKLQDGSTVKLADSTVTLAEGAKVAIGNGDDRPIPVRVAGGRGAPVSEYWSLRVGMDIPAAEVEETAPAGEWYTVPAGKVLVVEGMSGQVSSGVGVLWIERASCPEPSPGGAVFGTITENRHSGPDTWSAAGAFNFRGGCVLKPVAAHASGKADDWAIFNLYGRLVDDE